VDRLRKELPEILAAADNGLPTLARQLLGDLLEQLRFLDAQLEHYDRQVAQPARASEPARRLMEIEGIGPLTATALVASVGDAQPA
jgi:transposase